MEKLLQATAMRDGKRCSTACAAFPEEQPETGWKHVPLQNRYGRYWYTIETDGTDGAGRDSIGREHPINPLAINSRDMKGNEIKLFIRFARHDRAGKLVRNELQQGGIQAGRCGGGWKMRRELARVTACCCQFAMRGKWTKTMRKYRNREGDREREREDAVQQSNKRIELPIIQFNNGTGYSLP